MKTRFAILAAGLAVAALVAVPASGAAQSDRDQFATVRVVNYHKTNVRVFAFDADGRRQLLGMVRPGDYRELALDESLIRGGPVQVKAYPVIQAGLGSPAAGEYGVRSNNLYLDRGDVVDLWLEPRLETSMLRLTRS